MEGFQPKSVADLVLTDQVPLQALPGACVGTTTCPYRHLGARRSVVDSSGRRGEQLCLVRLHHGATGHVYLGVDSAPHLLYDFVHPLAQSDERAAHVLKFKAGVDRVQVTTCRVAGLQQPVQVVDEPTVALVWTPPHRPVRVGAERPATQLLPHAPDACTGDLI